MHSRYEKVGHLNLWPKSSGNRGNMGRNTIIAFSPSCVMMMMMMMIVMMMIVMSFLFTLVV
jgi:hypothetical protein